jgi:hypothetical protein
MGNAHDEWRWVSDRKSQPELIVEDGSEVSTAVVEAVARYLDVDPLALAPLGYALDADALDALFGRGASGASGTFGASGTPGANDGANDGADDGVRARLQFEYAGCVVEVRDDGAIFIAEKAGD